eukprot:1180160-Prorocentrum_minimum.AAC.1
MKVCTTYNTKDETQRSSKSQRRRFSNVSPTIGSRSRNMLWRLLGLVPVRGICSGISLDWFPFEECPGVSLDWFPFEEYALASPWIGS